MRCADAGEHFFGPRSTGAKADEQIIQTEVGVSLALLRAPYEVPWFGMRQGCIRRVMMDGQ